MITPIILAGGAGTRLWPLSRKAYPKQFTELVGTESLYQATLRRLSGAGFADPVIVTGDDYRFISVEQADDAGVAPGAVLIEPEGRNTAPAVLAAALLYRDDPERILMVAPSDHAIGDEAGFAKALDAARDAAEDGSIVTFGCHPTRPETGYGYLELSQPVSGDGNSALPVVSFVEKPDADTAIKLLETGQFLWNSGMFMLRVDAILDAYAQHVPEMVGSVEAALKGAREDLCFTRLAAGPWSMVEDISVDYAVMEKASDLAVVPLWKRRCKIRPR